jgi:SAM-dependent methyltransferase
MGLQLPQQGRRATQAPPEVPSSPLALRCPGCAGRLQGASHLRCPRCGRVVPADPLDIWRLSSSDRAWPDVPEGFARAVLRARTTDHMVAVLADPVHHLTRPQKQWLLSARAGGVAVLAPVRDGSTVLVLGTPASTLPRALHSLGAEVAWLDWYEARLRFGQLMCTPQAAITAHVAPDEPLPFSDGVFDFVFADVDEIARVHGGGARSVRRTLTELRRVLHPAGTAVIASSNPLRRTAGNGQLTPVGRAGAVVGTGGRPGGTRLLHAAGFHALRVVVPYPDRHGWQRLIPQERLRADLMQPRGVASSAGLVPSLLRRAAAWGGLARWIVPDHIVLARRDAGHGPPATLAESLEVFAGGAPPIMGALGDARVTMAAGDVFVKFPLSSSQQHALAEEVEKTARARSTDFEPFTLPWALTRHWHGTPYSVFPRVPQHRRVPREDAWEAVLEALRAQGAERLVPLSETALWSRLGSPQGERDVDEVGAASLRDAVLDRCAHVVAPVGATHGDLHAMNVLLRERRRPVLVDWNRFEVCNPLVLDAASAAVDAHRRRTGASFGAALCAFADGELDGPLARRGRELLGDLTPLQAATLVLLDRTVSYGSPRSRYRPWKLEPLRTANEMLTRRLGEWPV